MDYLLGSEYIPRLNEYRQVKILKSEIIKAMKSDKGLFISLTVRGIEGDVTLHYPDLDSLNTVFGWI